VFEAEHGSHSFGSRIPLLVAACERHLAFIQTHTPMSLDQQLQARTGFLTAMNSAYESRLIVDEDLEQALSASIWAVGYFQIRQRIHSRYVERFGTEPFRLDPSAA